jgi:hypothetical protein
MTATHPAKPRSWRHETASSRELLHSRDSGQLDRIPYVVSETGPEFCHFALPRHTWFGVRFATVMMYQTTFR